MVTRISSRSTNLRLDNADGFRKGSWLTPAIGRAEDGHIQRIHEDQERADEQIGIHCVFYRHTGLLP